MKYDPSMLNISRTRQLLIDDLVIEYRTADRKGQLVFAGPDAQAPWLNSSGCGYRKFYPRIERRESGHFRDPQIG